MVTCRSRQRIELPGDAGVGTTVTSVAVGCGAVVAAGVGVSPGDVQAVRMRTPRSRRFDVLFMAVVVNGPIVIRWDDIPDPINRHPEYCLPSWALRSKNKETSVQTGLFFAPVDNFLLLGRLSLGCFISLFRFDVLLDLLKLFLLLFFAFLCQFLLALLVLVIYFSQCRVLSCSRFWRSLIKIL